MNGTEVEIHVLPCIPAAGGFAPTLSAAQPLIRMLACFLPPRLVLCTIDKDAPPCFWKCNNSFLQLLYGQAIPGPRAYSSR